LANLTDTAARGGAIPAILDALNRTEAERRALVAQLADLEAAPSKVPDARDLRGTLHRYLDDWHSLAGGNVPETRRLLDSVLGGRIVFKPVRGGPATAVILAARLLGNPVMLYDGRFKRPGNAATNLRSKRYRIPLGTPHLLERPA